MIIDLKRKKLNDELLAINDLQQELGDAVYAAIAKAMDQCKARKTNPGVYWAMLSTTLVGLLTSQARGMGMDRQQFLDTVEALHDLSRHVNMPPGPPTRRDQ